MTSFYSILFLTIRPEIQEKISIGLLMSNGKQALFDYSPYKLELSKKFISTESYKLVKDSIKNIQNALTLDIKRKSLDKNSLFINEKVGSLFNEKYINYLANYNTNLFTFINPQQIKLEINEQNFQNLYKKLIDDNFSINKIEDKQKSIHDYVKKNLILKVKNKVNTYFDVTKEYFDKLVGVVKIDIIGKNGVYLTAQSIEFDKNPLLVTSDIGKYELLRKSILDKKQIGNKFYIIGSEPPKESRIEHIVWEDMRNNSSYTYIDKTEYPLIKEYIDSQGVMKLVV